MLYNLLTPSYCFARSNNSDCHMFSLPIQHNASIITSIMNNKISIIFHIPIGCLTDRLPINRDAALQICNMHPTNQVHCTYFQIKTKLLIAINFAMSSFIFSLTLRVIHSSGQAELEPLVRRCAINSRNPFIIQPTSDLKCLQIRIEVLLPRLSQLHAYRFS